MQQSSYLSLDEGSKKARHYCAYQERCSEDVKKKLLGWGLGEQQTIEVIDQLEKEGFLSDIRFAGLFVRSKINQNRWGKHKIETGLKSRNISDEIIAGAIANIDVDVYNNNIRLLIINKLEGLERFEPSIKKQKITQYLVSKGYEPEIVNEFVKSI